jgi:hypothetical protein
MTKGRAVLSGRVVAEREPFFISTGAYPAFLLRAAGNGNVRLSVRESRMQNPNATDLDRKSGGA